MGLSGISPWSLLIIFGIVALLFGTKKLRSIGGDVGRAVKSFQDETRSTTTKNSE